MNTFEPSDDELAPFGTSTEAGDSFVEQIRVRFVQRQIVGETNLALHLFLGVGRPTECCDLTFDIGLAQLVEEMFVIVWFGSQDEVHVEALQLEDVRRVTG